MRWTWAGVLLAGWVLGAQGWEVVKGSEGIAYPGDAVQTPDGYLWVSAGTQLHRYDGRNFVVYGEAEGLLARGFASLAADGDGALLAGTSTGLFRLEGGRFRRIYEGNVVHVAVSEKGLIAMNAEDGTLVLGRDGRWNRVAGKGTLLGQVTFDRSGGLLFGCQDTICELSAEQLTGWERVKTADMRQTRTGIIPSAAAGMGLAIQGLNRDRWGRIWVRDWQRVYVADRVEGPYRRQNDDTTGGGGIALVRRSRGGMVYFSGPKGIAVGNRKGELEWLGRKGKAIRAAGSMGYWDDQGLLWVGQDRNGLLRAEMKEPLYRRWGRAEGLDAAVFGVLGLRDGRTAAGTERGVYMMGPEEKRWQVQAATVEKYGGVAAMVEARDGAVLFGVNRGPPTLARLERDGRVSQVYLVPPVADGPNVYTMAGDPRGVFWLGTARVLYQGVERGRDVTITPVKLTDRPGGHSIFGMAFDDQGRLVVASAYGLFRKDGEKVERWTAKDGLLRTSLQYLARDGAGRYWVSYLGVNAMAVVELNGGKAKVTPVPSSLGFGPVMDLLGDRRGWMWIGDDRGVWVNKTGGLAAEDFQRVGEEIVEISKGVNSFSLHEDAQGRIWGAGTEGTVRIEDPELFVDQRTGPAPVTVTGLQFDGRAGSELRAQLHAPRLRGMEAVRFRWRLGSGDWKVSEDGGVRVETVPAGELVLEAQAEHRSGNWTSAVVRVPVVSVVPWWRASWFWWVAGVVLLGVGGHFRGRWKREQEEAAAYAAAKLAFLEQQRGLPVFGGRYQGLAVIGTGAFATVYRAADELDGKEVAVKALVSAAAVRKELDREVESLRRISHPGVVGILDYSIGEDGGAYLVLDYVPGPTLREVLEIGAMERGRVAVLARQLGEALGAAHAAGVIHRDLKPENVILRPEGEEERAVIVDFGIAVCKPPGATSARATSVGGTLFYLAPEQMGGAARPTADIYSFAVILCEALTGVCPEIVEEQGLERRAEAAGRLLAGDPVAELICGAMAYEAGLRPKDAAAFGLAVEAVLLGFYGKK